MSAFDSGHGSGMEAGADLEEMLQQMFGMGGGMPPGFGGARPQKPRKGSDEEHPYQVTLEELYKGKTAKFASTKNVICSHCKGSGGKEKAKPKQCASCQGRGMSKYHSKVTFLRAYEELQVSSKVSGPLGQAWSPKRQSFAALAKAKAACTIRKTGARSARGSG